MEVRCLIRGAIFCNDGRATLADSRGRLSPHKFPGIDSNQRNSQMPKQLTDIRYHLKIGVVF
jgi:hypothetical protein